MGKWLLPEIFPYWFNYKKISFTNFNQICKSQLLHRLHLYLKVNISASKLFRINCKAYISVTKLIITHSNMLKTDYKILQNADICFKIDNNSLQNLHFCFKTYKYFIETISSVLQNWQMLDCSNEHQPNVSANSSFDYQQNSKFT